jgi:hypothetical protein
MTTPQLRAVLLLGGAVLLAGLWAALSMQPITWMCMDLYPTWIAAQVTAVGAPEAAYNAGVWTGQGYHPAWIAAMKAKGLPTSAGTSFHYGPAYLWLTWPLTRLLSLPQLTVLFFAGNALSVSYLALELGRPLGWTRPWLRALPMLLLGLSFPVLYAVELGQNVPITLALAWAGARALGPGEKPWLGISLWVLASLFKPWFVLAFVLLLLAKRWKDFAAGAGAWALLAVLLPKVLTPELAAGYSQVNQALLTTTVVPQNNISLRSHVLRLSDPDWIGMVSNWQPVQISPQSMQLELYALLAVGLGILVWGLIRPRAWLDLVRVGLVAMLLPLGIVWTHYLIFAFPLIAALVADGRRPLRWLGIALSTYMLAMWPHAIQDPVHAHRWKDIEAFALADPSLGALRAALPLALVVLALLVFAATRRPAAEAPNPSA